MPYGFFEGGSHGSPKDLLQHQLQNDHIQVPPRPDSRLTKPRQWLLRGESSDRRLRTGEPFTPQSGQLGTAGVFMGDCLAPVHVSENCVVYIFPSSISRTWISSISGKFIQLMENYAQQHGLNTRTISGGAEAMEAVYRQYPVYNPREGIATVPYDLPLSAATQIIMFRKFYDTNNIKEIENRIGIPIKVIGG